MKRCLMAFCLLALLLSATGAYAFSIAGTVTGGESNWLMLKYVVAVPLRLDTANILSNITIANPLNGRYTLSNLDSGNYIIFSFQDIHQSLPPYPQLDDPRGFYGDSTLPVIMALQSDTTGIDIVLRPPNSGGFSGSLSYSGTHTGMSYVMASRNPDFSTIGGAGIIIDTVQNGNGSYTALTDTFGTYYAYAFMDLNGNFSYDDGEPYGIYGGTTPQAINVQQSSFPDNVDIVMTDPSDAPNRPIATTLDFALNAVYPNPFNSQARVSFTLPATSPISLNVYDGLGRQVRQLAGGIYPAGASVLTFDAGQLPSGLYYLKLQTNSGMAVQKALLLR